MVHPLKRLNSKFVNGIGATIPLSIARRLSSISISTAALTLLIATLISISPFFEHQAYGMEGGRPIPETWAKSWNDKLSPVVRISTDMNCSAVFLDSRHLLTAAHCVETLSNIAHLVINDVETGVKYKRKAVAIPHPLYPKNWFRNNPTPVLSLYDIAVVRLSQELSRNTEYAILPSAPTTPESKLALIANGSAVADEPNSNKVQNFIVKKLRTPPQTDTSSPASREEFYYSAVADVAGSGVCGEDSGGGYFKVHPDSYQLEVVAIQSTRVSGVSCSDARNTAFIAPVYENLSWINQYLTQSK